MPDNIDPKKRFYGVSEEELWKAQQKRRVQEDWENHFSNSVKTMRGNGQDMSKIRTPRLDEMRRKLSTMWRAVKIMGATSLLLSVYFATLGIPISELKERKAYEKLTEEEKQIKREQNERQRYGGKTFDELTEQEKDYYLEYYLQKERQENEEVMEYGFTKESEKEFNDYMLKHLIPVWAPIIFMLFLYLGHKKRAREHEQAVADAANFMLDWAEMGANYAINPEMLKNIMSDRFARDIIAYMAPTEAVWFEMLLDGNVEIADNPDFKNMAITILARYLDHHPEAFDVIMKKFARDAIPKELMPGNNYATVPMYDIKFNR
ncbi:MAG: hypothetical protein IKS08_05030 [Alphaproteobacteria bacterium]|nr:hypothetical protein [Alphaproteobacteria bacterium]